MPDLLLRLLLWDRIGGRGWERPLGERRAEVKQETDITTPFDPKSMPLWLCQTLQQTCMFSAVGEKEENNLGHVITLPGNMRQGMGLFCSQAGSPSGGWSFSSLPGGKSAGEGPRKESRFLSPAPGLSSAL